MFLSINPNHFNYKNIRFSEKKKNNIINKGDFFRILYSDTLYTSNGVFFLIKLYNTSISKYFNKLKITFTGNKNDKIILLLQNIEKKILSIFEDKTKTPTYRIKEQLNNKIIKLYNNKTSKFKIHTQYLELILKISGIWCNETAYGLTFRFYTITRQL